MKYAIQFISRFENKEDRNAAYQELISSAKQRKGDIYINMHRCFHDEEKPRPCIVEQEEEIRKVIV